MRSAVLLALAVAVAACSEDGPDGERSGLQVEGAGAGGAAGAKAAGGSGGSTAGESSTAGAGGTGNAAGAGGASAAGTGGTSAGTGGSPPVQVCTPGKQDPCACPAGVQGAQACKADGSGFDACVCPGAGGAGGGAGSSGAAGSAGAKVYPPGCHDPCVLGDAMKPECGPEIAAVCNAPSPAPQNCCVEGKQWDAICKLEYRHQTGDTCKVTDGP